jgi:glycosyltransferase involved in cell wall biosynthesis
VPLKNRTRFKVTRGKKQLTLPLFENNVRALARLYDRRVDTWELVIADYASDDVPNLQQYLQSIAGTIPVRVLQQPGPFNRGKARNAAARKASHDILFFLDADMEIRTRRLFDDIERDLVRGGCALFPICYMYNTPQHTTGSSHAAGFGNCVCTKKMYRNVGGFPEYTTWGREDRHFFMKFRSTRRWYYGEGFVHQWHPISPEFKDKYAVDTPRTAALSPRRH